MTEQTPPYEALLAFAQTKGPAFDAFMRDWKETHPTPEPTLSIAIEPPVKRVRKVTVKDEPEPEPSTANSTDTDNPESV